MTNMNFTPKATTKNSLRTCETYHPDETVNSHYLVNHINTELI